MSDLSDILNMQGYVHLKDFLDKENCKELTVELKRLVEENKTVKDSQCPLSQAVYGDPVFDSLLEQLLPQFEYASGKRLYPTYAYARLYAPGDELKIHTDRPACQISSTITLGFDPEGSGWSIYVGDYSEENFGREVVIEDKSKKWLINEAEIKMDVGDAVLYYGMDKVHWRNPYKEGKWQAQVFLHYVDADGPYADCKYDKRKKLSHHKDAIIDIKDYTYWHFSDALDINAANKIIESIEHQVEGEDGAIGGDINIVNKTIRDVKRVSLPTHRGIGATMAGMGISANNQAWKFDVTHANQCDYLKYDVDGHYYPHIDTFMNPEEKNCRKLTVLMFLNDDFEGGRLFIQIGHEKIYPPQKAGTCLVFPSFMLHGVEPVTKGIRRTIVTWIVGPWFK
jgi:predicted 2-oxoglutarate/Fe(II)-dependent dioxygenase YbiX